MIALAGALALVLTAAALAPAVVTQRKGIRLSVNAEMNPTHLPRVGTAPISVSIGAEISTTDERPAPALKAISIEINRHGRLDFGGLPVCRLSRIQPASSGAALAACRPALVGRGRFRGSITLPSAPAYPISGSLMIFNGRQQGRPVLFAHAFSGKPIATSFVMKFRIFKRAHGTYGTALTADLTQTLGRKRSLNFIEMTLSRRYSAAGRRHSFLSAGCPAPRGVDVGVFRLARTTFAFAGGKRLTATEIRSCKVR
jgi:hypothetical protein